MNWLEKMHSEKGKVTDSTSISDIKPIDLPQVYDLDRKTIPMIIEAPLVEACEELFDKGIRTMYSSANLKNVTLVGGIMIHFPSLSEENKKIGEKIGKVIKLADDTEPSMLRLDIHIPEGSTVGDIKKIAKELVSQFKSQK